MEELFTRIDFNLEDYPGIQWKIGYLHDEYHTLYIRNTGSVTLAVDYYCYLNEPRTQILVPNGCMTFTSSEEILQVYPAKAVNYFVS